MTQRIPMQQNTISVSYLATRTHWTEIGPSYLAPRTHCALTAGAAVQFRRQPLCHRTMFDRVTWIDQHLMSQNSSRDSVPGRVTPLEPLTIRGSIGQVVMPPIRQLCNQDTRSSVSLWPPLKFRCLSFSPEQLSREIPYQLESK